MVKDYFSFETIRDKNGDVICYHVTAIGTIEKDGVTRMRSDLGTDGDKRMAFGKLTIRGRDRMIGLLLRETGSRAYWRSTDEQGPYCILSFAAREKHAEEVYNFNEGDRVLIEGRAYVRQNSSNQPDRLPELSITVNSTFLLGRRRRPQTLTSSIIPQKHHFQSGADEDEEPMHSLSAMEPETSSWEGEHEPEREDTLFPDTTNEAAPDNDDDAPMQNLTPDFGSISDDDAPMHGIAPMEGDRY